MKPYTSIFKEKAAKQESTAKTQKPVAKLTEKQILAKRVADQKSFTERLEKVAALIKKGLYGRDAVALKEAYNEVTKLSKSAEKPAVTGSTQDGDKSQAATVGQKPRDIKSPMDNAGRKIKGVKADGMEYQGAPEQKAAPSIKKESWDEGLEESPLNMFEFENDLDDAEKQPSGNFQSHSNEKAGAPKGSLEKRAVTSASIDESMENEDPEESMEEAHDEDEQLDMSSLDDDDDTADSAPDIDYSGEVEDEDNTMDMGDEDGEEEAGEDEGSEQEEEIHKDELKKILDSDKSPSEKIKEIEAILDNEDEEESEEDESESEEDSESDEDEDEEESMEDEDSEDTEEDGEKEEE
jgi:hypothetical protein